MSNDEVGVNGYVVVVKRDRHTGEVKEKREKKNIVVDDGKELIASRLRDNDTAPSHIAVGDSSSSTSAGQSALQGSELKRIAITSTSQNGNELTYTGDFTGSWTGTVEEAGIFNASSAGVMLCRFLTGTFDKDSNDEIEVRWTLTIG